MGNPIKKSVSVPNKAESTADLKEVTPDLKEVTPIKPKSSFSEARGDLKETIDETIKSIPKAIGTDLNVIKWKEDSVTNASENKRCLVQDEQKRDELFEAFIKLGNFSEKESKGLRASFDNLLNMLPARSDKEQDLYKKMIEIFNKNHMFKENELLALIVCFAEFDCDSEKYSRTTVKYDPKADLRDIYLGDTEQEARIFEQWCVRAFNGQNTIRPTAHREMLHRLLHGERAQSPGELETFKNMFKFLQEEEIFSVNQLQQLSIQLTKIEDDNGETRGDASDCEIEPRGDASDCNSEPSAVSLDE